MNSFTHHDARRLVLAAAAAFFLNGCAVAPPVSKPPAAVQPVETRTDEGKGGAAPAADSPSANDSVEQILRELKAK
ncbi:MAG: hypothetical protein WC859_09420 [Elusimicrobiota bacterium]|jgi:hypothetical protein